MLFSKRSLFLSIFLFFILVTNTVYAETTLSVNGQTVIPVKDEPITVQITEDKVTILNTESLTPTPVPEKQADEKKEPALTVQETKEDVAGKRHRERRTSRRTTITPTQIKTPTPTQTPDKISKPTKTATPSPTKTTPTPTKTQSVSLSEELQYIMHAINDYRDQYGLPPVKTDPYTCNFAKTRAKEIVSGFNHDGFRKRVSSDALPYPSYRLVTENLARTADYKRVVTLWINSPGHAANMKKDTPYVCVQSSGDHYAYEGWKP